MYIHDAYLREAKEGVRSDERGLRFRYSQRGKSSLSFYSFALCEKQTGLLRVSSPLRPLLCNCVVDTSGGKTMCSNIPVLNPRIA